MKKKLFREYKSIQPQENHWGIRVKNAGYTHVHPGEKYPDNEHPTEYFFTWEHGRKLNEYQIILITHGNGKFEAESTRLMDVKSGSLILVYKEEWHRYRPLKETGWQEYWVGFDGKYARQIIRNSMFTKKNPVIHFGDNEMISNLFIEIFDWLENQVLGHEKVVASYVPLILAKLESITKQQSKNIRFTEQKVKAYQLYLLENFDQNPNLPELASSLNVSYSWLRKMFKQLLGIAPNQYLLKLKLQKARDLLIMTNHSIKSISLMCGFSSPYYFSRYFKEECGMSPKSYRNKLIKLIFLKRQDSL